MWGVVGCFWVLRGGGIRDGVFGREEGGNERAERALGGLELLDGIGLEGLAVKGQCQDKGVTDWKSRSLHWIGH